MELRLKENKDGSKQTRIRISTAECREDNILRTFSELLYRAGTLEKESSRFKYFIVDGDLLNKKRG